MTLIRRILVLAAAMVCTTCGLEREGGVPGVTRVDSVGVEIIRNSDDELRRGELVTPAIRIFGSETPGPELFGGISIARLHQNGSVWVAERFTQEIRVFDSDSGPHLFTIGGVGEGPGEFRRLRMLGFDREGTAYVYDDRTRRLSVFTEDGEFLRTKVMPSSLGIAPRPLHVSGSGDLLGQLPRALSRVPTDRTTIRDTVRIWTIPLENGGPTLIASTLGALWYFSDGMQVTVPYTGLLPPPYGGGVAYGFRDDRVYVTGDSGGASFSVFGPGGLERRVELDREPRRIDEFSATRFVEHMRRVRLPESRVRFYEEHLPEMPIPETASVWERIVVTDEGGVWLLRAADFGAGDSETTVPDQVWDVFDAEGAFVGVMRIPSNISPKQVVGRSILTIVRDEVGRESVAIYDVRWVE